MRKRLFVICLVLGLWACDDTYYSGSTVPYAHVRYTVYITTEYPHFIADNGFQTLPPVTKKRYDTDYIGYAGLLIWVGMDNAYHAADLCCPHCLKPSQPVYVDGIYAVCPVCDEAFDLSYGYCSPLHGTAKTPLKTYTARVQQKPTGVELYISN